MESLRNLALNVVPLNASVPAYFAEEVRIARIFKQILIDNTRSLTDEEVQSMELLKVGFIPIGWKKFKMFKTFQSCKFAFPHCKRIWGKRDTLQNMMINFGICKKCNKLLFKTRNIKIAFSIEKNDFVPVNEMDLGLFNYITKKHLVCEFKDGNRELILYNYNGYTFNYSHTALLLIRAFPTVKPMVLLRKTSIKINAGYSLQEFFELNKQWWGHDTTIDKDILYLYQSDIIYYICTELTNSVFVELYIKSENIEKIKQMLSSRLWHIKTLKRDEFLI
jgi:hypothetical protein